MGLFSRRDPGPLDGQKGRTRVPVSSEAQAAQWRAQGRRRLIGAVALVLAAVIVLPMVLDDEPVPVASDISIVIPDRNRPPEPQFAERSTDSAPSMGSEPDQTLATPSRNPPAVPELTRTDDGSRALALLEGRGPTDSPRSSGATDASNGYVLQVAAYSVRADALMRRDRLKRADVVNAFVEQATVNGKPQYRLRVGPFPTREAAQEVQTKLRALGYDNGFIAAQ